MGHICDGTVHISVICELLSMQKIPVKKIQLVFYSLLECLLKTYHVPNLGIYDEKDIQCLRLRS